MVATLINYQGTIGANEIFQHSIVVDTVSGDAQAAIDAELAFQSAWLAGGGFWASAISDAVTYEQVSAATILDLNTGALQAASFAPFDLFLTGTGQAGAFQNCGAVSLTGGTYANGTPVRGRFFLPLMGETAISDGVFNTNARDAVAAFVAELFVQMVALDLDPQVWSRKLGSTGPVATARFGSVVDTIRSRRNGIVETYTDITVP